MMVVKKKEKKILLKFLNSRKIFIFLKRSFQYIFDRLAKHLANFYFLLCCFLSVDPIYLTSPLLSRPQPQPSSSCLYFLSLSFRYPYILSPSLSFSSSLLFSFSINFKFFLLFFFYFFPLDLI